MGILFLVRHGECVANVFREFAGSDEDDYLTQRGRWQAEAAGRALADTLPRENGDFAIVASTLLRARETAEIMVRCFPKILVLPPDVRLAEKAPGESFDHVAERVATALRELSAGHERVVVVTHGHVIQAVGATLLGMPDPERLLPANGGITRMDGGTLRAFNSDLHLAGTP